MQEIVKFGWMVVIQTEIRVWGVQFGAGRYPMRLLMMKRVDFEGGPQFIGGAVGQNDANENSLIGCVRFQEFVTVTRDLKMKELEHDEE